MLPQMSSHLTRLSFRTLPKYRLTAPRPTTPPMHITFKRPTDATWFHTSRVSPNQLPPGRGGPFNPDDYIRIPKIVKYIYETRTGGLGFLALTIVLNVYLFMREKAERDEIKEHEKILADLDMLIDIAKGRPSRKEKEAGFWKKGY